MLASEASGRTQSLEAVQQPVDYAGQDLRGETVFGSYLYMPALGAYLLGEQSQAETNRCFLRCDCRECQCGCVVYPDRSLPGFTDHPQHCCSAE